MNLNCHSQKLGFIEKIFESTAEHSLDVDITLPDYCPDIQRILKCNVSANVNTVQNISGRVTADVNAVVRLVYIGENGKISGYEQSYPIQKYIESIKIQNTSAVNVNVCIDYVNCRAVNPRRTDIKAMLTFIFKAINKIEDKILCDADGAGIQTIKEDYNFASLSGMCEKIFSMNEVIEIPEQKNSVAQIINVCPYAMINETKIINNKVLIKGDCSVKISYISDNDEIIDCIEHSMPISQIIETDGLNENNVCNITVNVCSCEAVAKSDSSGNMRLIDLNARINAFVTSFEEIPVSLISDAYSTEYNTNNIYKNIEINEYQEKVNSTFTNKVVLESIGVSVDSVVAVWCSDLKCNFISKNKGLLISGTYQANVLYRDSEGKTDIVQKIVDYEYIAGSDYKSENISCFCSAQITACSCSVTGDSRLELKAEIYISGIILSKNNKRYISSISLSDETFKKNKTYALTIYFCNDGEDVWDIARKYNTTVDAIMNENELTERIIHKSKMMLIPAI